jgi:class 3 adenylate cyclase
MNFSMIKSPRADASAPWMKDEVDEFEDVTDLDVYCSDKADKALIHAVKTLAELTRDLKLKAYSSHPRVTPRFQQSYQCKVTFGLHCGYAVEGSVGTNMKVDALYISSDTQIAARIEELNDKYNTKILISGDLYDIMSEKG